MCSGFVCFHPQNRPGSGRRRHVATFVAGNARRGVRGYIFLRCAYELGLGGLGRGSPNAIDRTALRGGVGGGAGSERARASGRGRDCKGGFKTNDALRSMLLCRKLGRKAFS